MTEEITRELIQEISKETAVETFHQMMQGFNQTGDTWVQTLGIIGTIAGSVAAMLFSYRQHNQKQEINQKQFNEIQNEKQKLEFMKRLEFYETKITKNSDAFAKTPQKYDECILFARRQLSILDRIAYLKNENIINEKLLNYFEPSFNKGRTYLKWLKNYGIFYNVSYEGYWKNFIEIKKTIEFSPKHAKIALSFYHYVHQFNTVPNYDPREDIADPRQYHPDKADVKSIKPLDDE